MHSKNRMRGMITLDTLMPLSLAISIVGGGVWVGNIQSRLERNVEDIVYLREQRQKFDMILSDRLDQSQRDISDIKSMTAAIDAKISILTDRVKK